ncbi:NADH dehydrogenase, partial [Streptomyces oceani]
YGTAVEATGGAGPASLAGLRLAKGETPAGRVVSPRAGEPPAGERPATHPSSHDAPQQNAPSDPAHPSGPVTEEGK